MFLKVSNMRITGLRNNVNQNQLIAVLKKHTGKDASQVHTIARQILNGSAIQLDDDWALEQDLKDLGVRVD